MTRKYFLLEEVIYMAAPYYQGIYKTKEEADKNCSPSSDMYACSSVESISIESINDIKKLVQRIHRGARKNKFKLTYERVKNKFVLRITSERFKEINISSFISEQDVIIKTINQLLKLKF